MIGGGIISREGVVNCFTLKCCINYFRKIKFCIIIFEQVYIRNLQRFVALFRYFFFCLIIEKSIYSLNYRVNLMQKKKKADNLDCHFLIILLIICKRTLLAVSFALKFTLMIQRSDTTEGTKGNSPGA